jgi:hypothetical protein
MMSRQPALPGGVVDDARRSTVVYRGLGQSFQVTCAEPRLEARVRTLLAPLLETSPQLANGGRVVEHIKVARDGESWTFIAEQSDLGLSTEGLLLDHLLWYVNFRAIEDVASRGTGFHAAAVQRGPVTLLCAAESGSGKSTLAAALVRDGWTYLSDEAVEVVAETGHLLPYPKPITIDAGAQQFFPEVRPEAEDTASWYVDPRAWGDRPTYVSAGATAVVLPRYSDAEHLTIEALKPGPALMALAPATFHFRRGPERNLRALGRLVRSTPVFRLTYGSVEQSLDGVARVVEEVTA